MKKDPDLYGDKEAKARFDAALRGGLSAPPKPLKDIPKKSGESRAKPKRRRTAR